VYVLRYRLVALVAAGVAPAIRAAARRSLKVGIDPHGYFTRVVLAGAGDPGAVFDELVQRGAREPPGTRAETLRQLGHLPGEVAPRVVDRLLASGTSASELWPALAAMLRRPASASAAWRAIDARLARVLGALRDQDVDELIAATGSLCDAGDRTTVATDLAPHAAASDRRRIALARAAAAIDRCIARRAAAGDLSRAFVLPAAGAPGSH
jgi:hypothetical protein